MSSATITVGGLNYKWTDEGCWIVWETKSGGIFKTLPEDAVPDEVWAKLAKDALLGDLNKSD